MAFLDRLFGVARATTNNNGNGATVNPNTGQVTYPGGYNLSGQNTGGTSPNSGSTQPTNAFQGSLLAGIQAGQQPAAQSLEVTAPQQQAITGPTQQFAAFPQTQTQQAQAVTGPAFTPPQIIPPEERTAPPPNQRSDLQIAADQVTAEMLSGNFAQGLQTQMAEATARGIANLRAGTANQLAQAGLTDQGAGRQAMGQVEELALRENSRNALMAEIAGQEVKERGVEAATARGYLDIAYQNQAVGQGLQQVQALVNAGDFEQASAAWKETFGYDIDLSRFEDIQDSDDYFMGAGNVAQMIELGKDMNSPEVRAELQKMWNLQGGKGSAPDDWVKDTYEGIAVAGNEFDYTIAQIDASNLEPEMKQQIKDLVYATWDGEAMGLNFVQGWEVVDGQGQVKAIYDNQQSAIAHISDLEDSTGYTARQSEEKRLTFLDGTTGNTYGGFGTYKNISLANDPNQLNAWADKIGDDWQIDITAAEASNFVSDMGLGDSASLENVTRQQLESWIESDDNGEYALGIVKNDIEYPRSGASGPVNTMVASLLSNNFQEEIDAMEPEERDAKAKEAGFASYAQYQRLKSQAQPEQSSWEFGDWTSEMAPAMTTVAEKSGGTGQGYYSQIAAFDNNVYNAQRGERDFPSTLTFNDNTESWINDNKGSVVTLNLGNGPVEFWIDPTTPIVSVSKGTFTDKGYPKSKDALRAMNLNTGTWETIEWAGTWFEADQSMTEAERRVNQDEYAASGTGSYVHVDGLTDEATQTTTERAVQRGSQGRTR